MSSRIQQYARQFSGYILHMRNINYNLRLLNTSLPPSLLEEHESYCISFSRFYCFLPHFPLSNYFSSTIQATLRCPAFFSWASKLTNRRRASSSKERSAGLAAASGPYSPLRFPTLPLPRCPGWHCESSTTSSPV